MSFSSSSEQSQELAALLIGHWLTDTANFAAFVYQNLPNLNWAGFYFADEKLLRLGSFVGKPACTEIAFNRGVCGAAYSRRESMVVEDVHAFPGHIACDAASNSELVVPLIADGECFGVFDLDSPSKGRFTNEDRKQVEAWVRILLQSVPADQWRKRPWIIH